MNQTDKKKLLRYIQEVSFAIDDVVLYLDTHPYDEEALKYYKKYKKLYHEASEEYTQYYGPLQTSNVIADEARGHGKEDVDQCGNMKNGCNTR